MPVNRITPSNATRIRVILATAFVIISSSWATADSLYRLTSLGTDFFPYRISESGQVVGAGEFGRNPALLWQDGVVKNLGAGAAQAINSAGQILLSSPRPGDGRNSPQLWQNGATTPLPIPPCNSDFRHYYDMNASGHVVGQALDRAFLWAEDRLMYLDSAFAGQQSSAYAINDAGKVVGRANTGFLWDQGKVTLLPDTAMDINNRDQVLLFSSLWESGVQTPITLLPPLPGSDPEMISFRAEAINDPGQVVARQRENYLISIEDGYGSRDRSLLWDPVLGSRDIADLLGDYPFEWTSAYVTDINSAGQIVGYRDNKGFLLTPVPEPRTVALVVCAALVAAVFTTTVLRRRPYDFRQIRNQESVGFNCALRTRPPGRSRSQPPRTNCRPRQVILTARFGPRGRSWQINLIQPSVGASEART